MTRIIVRLLSILILLLVFAIAQAQDEEQVDRSDWPSVFVIGQFEEARFDLEVLRAYLEESLGIPVLITRGSNYGAVISAMVEGRIDAMEVGSFSYVVTEREGVAEAVAVRISTGSSIDLLPTYKPFYYSVIVTRKGSGIRSLADLQGVDFAFVDPNSTSGRNAPAALLINEVDELETIEDIDNWLNPIFAGSHPDAVLALVNGDVQAAATFEGNLLDQRNAGVAQVCAYYDEVIGVTFTQEDLDALYEECPEGDLVVVAQTAPIPNAPFVVRSDLPESFKTAVQDALLDLRNHPEVVEQTRLWYVNPALDPELSEELGLDNLSEFYDVVRDIADITAND